MTSVEESSGEKLSAREVLEGLLEEVTLNRGLNDRNVRLACLLDQTSSSLRMGAVSVAFCIPDSYHGGCLLTSIQ